MKEFYNLIDQQLLGMLMTWDQIYMDRAELSERMPENWLELELSGESTPDMIRYDAESELLTGIELAARKLISSAEDAHLISMSDWHVINAILCNIGTNDPLTAQQLWWRFK